MPEPSAIRAATEHRELLEKVAELTASSATFVTALRAIVKQSGNAVRPTTYRLAKLEEQASAIRNRLMAVESQLRDLQQAHASAVYVADATSFGDAAKPSVAREILAAAPCLSARANNPQVAGNRGTRAEPAISRRNKSEMHEAIRVRLAQRAKYRQQKLVSTRGPQTPIGERNTTDPRPARQCQSTWQRLCERARELIDTKIPDGRGGQRVMTRAEIERQLKDEFQVSRDVAQSAATKMVKKFDPGNPDRRTHKIPVMLDTGTMAKITALAKEDHSAMQIAEKIGASVESVRRWLRKERHSNGVRDQP